MNARYNWGTLFLFFFLAETLFNAKLAKTSIRQKSYSVVSGPCLWIPSPSLMLYSNNLVPIPTLGIVLINIPD